MSEIAPGEAIVYERDDGAPGLEVRLQGETAWLSQQQLAELFQTSRTNVVEHIRNIFEEGELSEAATCRDFRQVRTEGARSVERSIPHYSLDVIISVGYRVKSAVATRFRIWATNRLREYLLDVVPCEVVDAFCWDLSADAGVESVLSCGDGCARCVRPGADRTAVVCRDPWYSRAVPASCSAVAGARGLTSPG